MASVMFSELASLGLDRTSVSNKYSLVYFYWLKDAFWFRGYIFLCSVQLSMKLQVFRSIKNNKNYRFFSALDKPRMFFLLINVAVRTIVGILTFISRKYFMLS